MRKIFETRVLAYECQGNHADRAVTLFADDDFCFAFIGRVGVVNFIPIDEQDQICILLDSAGFTQVLHDGAFIRTLFQTTVQLRKRYHRDFQFFG